MDYISAPSLTENDSRNCLDDAARGRIQAAHWQGLIIRQRVLAELEEEYRSKSNLPISSDDYMNSGEAAIRLSQARMEHARLILHACAKEYRTAGKSGSEVRQIMQEELKRTVKSLELTVSQGDLLSLPSERQTTPAELTRVTDEMYEEARRRAEQTYQIRMNEWLVTALAEAKKVPPPPQLDWRKILTETWSAAWRGETLPAEPDSRARVPSTLILKLVEMCQEFLKSELRAYLGLLERSGVPASQRLIRLESELGKIFAETRARKWNRTIKERMPGVFRTDEQWPLKAWDIVENVIQEFVHDDLEFDFWVGGYLSDTEPTMDGNTQPTKTQASTRAAVVLPILDKKGWSILDWAQESRVDYNTLNDYLSGARNPYRSTRLKMANGLGIDVINLPS